jgi:hypothetical protein
MWGLGVGLGALLLGTALAPYRGAFNFHVIAPGVAYRSNEPSPSAFERLLKTHEIRTVVSLGTGKTAEELGAIASRNGARFVVVSLRSWTLPRQSQLLQLLDLLERAEPPLLLVDGFGIYRTGLASAFLGIIRFEQDLPTARQALSLRYGFLPYGPYTEVTRAFPIYEGWLRRERLPATAQTLRRWAREAYLPYGYGVRLRPVRLPRDARPGELLRVTVDVENVSGRTWPKGTDPNSAIRLGLRLAPPGGSPSQEFRGDLLPHDVPPNGTARLSLDFQAPETAGQYELRLDLVEEHRAWFGDWGFPPVTAPLRVRR